MKNKPVWPLLIAAMICGLILGCAENADGQTTVIQQTEVIQSEALPAPSSVVQAAPVIVESPVTVGVPVFVEYAPIIRQRTLSRTRIVDTPRRSVVRTVDRYKDWAIRDANQRASRGVRGHILRPFSNTYTGVGWSTRSAQSALQNCCYWGQRQVLGYHVVRGARGWYASAIYR